MSIETQDTLRNAVPVVIFWCWVGIIAGSVWLGVRLIRGK